MLAFQDFREMNKSTLKLINLTLTKNHRKFMSKAKSQKEAVFRAVSGRALIS